MKSLFLRIKSLFGGSGRFNPLPAAGRLPATKVRVITAADHNACVRIYRENEERFFPPDYLRFFEQELSSDNNLWLGIEENNELVAVGGIRLDSEGAAAAALSFGMVRPDKHNMGYGSVLLLARLASLPPPDPSVLILMSSVENSVGFFKRFGFVFVKRIAMEDGIELDHYYAKLTLPSWEMIRALLSSEQVSFDPDDMVVPKSPLGS